MSVVIRLQRAGARHRPFYRIVVVDSRKPRDGAFLEKVGYYDPIPDPEVISIERARVEAWKSKGAKPTEAVRSLLKRFERKGAEPNAASPAPAVPPEEAAAPAGEADGEA